MIEVSWNTALMIYLCLTLGPLLVLWGYQHYQGRKAKINIDQHVLNVCEYCHFCYLDDCIKKITRCPQCHSYNRQSHSMNETKR